MRKQLTRRSRVIAILIAALGGVLLLVTLAAVWFYFQARASLPLLDGTHSVPGMSAVVSVTRDELGVPTISGGDRLDVARAFGFVHAQDRFFQMDLLRRRAAGELAALVGKMGLPLDRATRPHRFRDLARQVLADLPAEQRALLEAYTAGVNTGVAALRAKPFEYFFLRATPAPWKPEDSVLIVYAMTLDLQDATNNYELSLATVRDQLGTDALAFFAPLLTPADAALDGSHASLPAIPGPRMINLRSNEGFTAPPNSSARGRPRRNAPSADELQAGSSSFAVSGAHTASGAAMLANDPHLNHGIPNIWYRAVLEWPVLASGATPRNRIAGVSIPGVPFIVLGSNRHIAWGLTAAYVDTSDLVAVDVNPVARHLYKVPDREDVLKIELRRDTIEVKGGEPEVVETEWTFWGPIVARDFRDRPLAHRWVAHDPAATNLNFIQLETARNVTEATAIARNSGMPANNFLVADRAGDIAWTIAGKFPKRVGFDGRLPVSWSFGDRYWDGLVPPDSVPRISTAASNATGSPGAVENIPPSHDRLWTANNRLLGGPELALLGDGGYASPLRGVQVRDALLKMERATPRDFLALQRDNRGLFLDPWRTLLLAVLTPENIADHASRANLRRLIETWDGRASVDSVSYRLVRTFRSITAGLVLDPIFASCSERLETFDWHKFHYEPALWTLLEQKPAHLLAPEFATWDDLLLAAADQVVTQINDESGSLEGATWGARNTARIIHPLSRALPFGLGQWLNIPDDPLLGDIHMPLIQSPSFGASMRMVVSPGREHEAILHMPCGQSGHPLSTFYRAGHHAWLHGEPTPLLPGATVHTLQLTP